MLPAPLEDPAVFILFPLSPLLALPLVLLLPVFAFGRRVRYGWLTMLALAAAGLTLCCVYGHADDGSDTVDAAGVAAVLGALLVLASPLAGLIVAIGTSAEAKRPVPAGRICDRRP